MFSGTRFHEQPKHTGFSDVSENLALEKKNGTNNCLNLNILCYRYVIK